MLSARLSGRTLHNLVTHIGQGGRREAVPTGAVRDMVDRSIKSRRRTISGLQPTGAVHTEPGPYTGPTESRAQPAGGVSDEGQGGIDTGRGYASHTGAARHVLGRRGGDRHQPEVSSCRDSDKMVGFIASKSRSTETGQAPVRQTLLVTRYDPARVESNEMLTLADIQELLGLEVLGLIPESKAVLTATNVGQPVKVSEGDDAATACKDAVDRFLGKTVDLKSCNPNPPVC